MPALVYAIAWGLGIAGVAATAAYHFGRRRGHREGMRRGADVATELLSRSMIPMLVARGVTLAEISIALSATGVGCGEPDCEACSRLPKRERAMN